MKTIFVIVASIVTAVGFAQPVINLSNIPNYLPSEAMVASTNGIDFGTSGADKVWDFTHLELVPAGTNDIMLPLDTPLSTHFPDATHCMAYTNNSCEAYAFFTCDSEKIEWVGESFSCIGTIDPAANPKTYMTFPYTYNTVIRDDFKSGSGKTHSFVSTYDAYGTLIMPYGTHRNVIRQKIVHNGQTDYIWFNADPVYPIIQTEMADQTMGVTMNNAYDSSFEHDQSFSVASNTGGFFRINAKQPEDATITVYDLGGKKVASQKMKGQSTIVNMQHCDVGIYMVEMKTAHRIALQKVEKCSSIISSGFSDANGLVQSQP